MAQADTAVHAPGMLAIAGGAARPFAGRQEHGRNGFAFIRREFLAVHLDFKPPAPLHAFFDSSVHHSSTLLSSCHYMMLRYVS
jgi:hypothetical protein